MKQQSSHIHKKMYCVRCIHNHVARLPACKIHLYIRQCYLLQYCGYCHRLVLVHGQVTIIFVVSVCLSVCLFVCAEFFSAVFDPIWIKLGHMLHVRV